MSSRLTRLCRTFYYSLPSLNNIGMFLLLIYYIYAIAGMHLFSTIQMGTFINDDANFSSFGLSFLTLIRCTTGKSVHIARSFIKVCLDLLTIYTINHKPGENWNGLMHEADLATQETTGKMAILYFCSFVILISYVILNLFIATMLENFQVSMGTMSRPALNSGDSNFEALTVPYVFSNKQTHRRI